MSKAIIIDLTLYTKHNINKLNVSDMTNDHGFSTPNEFLFPVPSKTCCCWSYLANETVKLHHN
jgi:hypothetical protein